MGAQKPVMRPNNAYGTTPQRMPHIKSFEEYAVWLEAEGTVHVRSLWHSQTPRRRSVITLGSHYVRKRSSKESNEGVEVSLVQGV